VIEIGSAEDLAKIGNPAYPAYALDGNYRLVKNIQLTGTWTPIGSAETPFTGIFDGNGCVINGMNVTTSVGATGAAGLFAAVEGAQIKDLVLTDATISITDQAEGASNTGYVGILAGRATRSAITGVVVNAQKLAVSSITVNNAQANAVVYAGGIAGYVEYTVIEQSEADVTFDVTAAEKHTANIGGTVIA
jgi:hypothetical protein